MRPKKKDSVIGLLPTLWMYVLQCRGAVPLNLLSLPMCAKIHTWISGRSSVGWGGGWSVVSDICKKCFRKLLTMAPAWLSQRGPDVGRVRVLRLLHRSMYLALIGRWGGPLSHRDLFRWAAFSGCQHCSLMPGQRTHGQHWVTTASTWFTRNSVLLLCQEQETKAGEQIIPVLGCWAREGLSPLVMRRESLCGFEVQSFPLASWAALLEEPVMGAVTESWAVGLAEVFHEGLSPWHTLDWLGSSSMKSHSTFLSKNFHLYPVMSSPH